MVISMMSLSLEVSLIIRVIYSTLRYLRVHWQKKPTPKTEIPETYPKLRLILLSWVWGGLSVPHPNLETKVP